MPHQQTNKEIAAMITSTYANLTIIKLYFEQNKSNILTAESTANVEERLEDFSNRIHNIQNTFYNLDRISSNPRLDEKASLKHPFRAYFSWRLRNRRDYLNETLESNNLNKKLEEIEYLTSQMKESLGNENFFKSVEELVNTDEKYPLYNVISDAYLQIVGRLPVFVGIEYDLKFRIEPT